MPMGDASQYRRLPGLNGDAEHAQDQKEWQRARGKRDIAYDMW
ncbi:hypothetical protein Pcaca04_23370 [Pectobacterium carotovorum subsp. carotovorum]|nr:hypothetical protein Pcaca04_23370 [Pectobacterium carotovorum subsp. carotovorum]